MQELRQVKKQLVLDLDKNEAPTAWRWRIDRYVQFGDGQEKIIPDEIAAGAEEVQQHIGAAVGKQAEDIKADAAARDEERAVAKADCDALRAEVDRLTEALTASTEQAAGLIGLLARIYSTIGQVPGVK